MPNTKQAPTKRAPRDFRLAAGFTEADVVGHPDRALRVDLKTLRKVESGEDVTVRVLDRLARMFKAKPAEYAASYYAVRAAKGAA